MSNLEITHLSGPQRKAERPEEAWVRPDPCPYCGGQVVSNCYYVGGRGYVLMAECWEGLGVSPTCDWRRVL